jgi:hypothetical protein
VEGCGAGDRRENGMKAKPIDDIASNDAETSAGSVAC